jgi:hypothetical protein
MINITKDSAKVFNYKDTLPNFVQDCKTLGIEFPNFASIDVVFDDCLALKYQISNNNQMALEKRFQDFIQKILAVLPALNQCKSDREKPVPLTFEQEKAQAYNSVNVICSTARQKIAKTSDPNKIGSWAVYKSCAERYLNKTLPESEKTMLLDEIKIRNIAGETLDTFVQKIMDNSTQFLKATTIIAGLEKRAVLDIDVATNVDQLKLIVSNLGKSLSIF